MLSEEFPEMSQIKSAPNDFIQQSFSPMIAVMCTPGVEEVCKKNNLNFIQLVKPFSKATADGLLKDPSSTTQIPIRGLRVTFSDINSRPPPPPVARSYFNFSISSNVKEKTTKILVGGDSIDVPVSTPWFEAWRDTFFQVQYPSDHEFTKHYVGCLIVISSLDASPLERLEELLESLQGQINSGPNKLPKWFGTSFVLTTFLYLHDNSISKLDISVFEAMKVTYGINKCFLLCINSFAPEDAPRMHDPWEKYISTCIEYKEDGKEREVMHGVETAREAGEKSSPSTPDIVHPLSPLGDDENYNICKDILSPQVDLPPHGKLLNAEDLERIKQFINDFCVKALIPHFEQCIHQLSDQISNKKGVSRSLFSATKRWFGSNKPGAPGNHISPTAIAYSPDSHELQLRKLGDLCFMVGHYPLAFTAYHSAKRDFGADGAWLHYAGALEMAALSAYLSNSESLARKVVEYAEESIITYQNSCRMNQFATRATLLSVECLKGRGLYGEAAMQLIRMSGEDSDLRSAVLLEQAAYCFLSSLRPVMYRKYAFHMVLAGHRFSKAAHRVHSMRCYYQAYQVYGNKSWSVAEDHILYTIGKHAASLQMAPNAVKALGLLVSRSSRQSPQQQELYLKDYLSTIEHLDEISFSLPVIDCNLTQVLLSIPNQRHPSGTVSASGFVYSTAEGFQSLSNESVWWKLEEKLVISAGIYGNMLLFKHTIELLTNSTNNSSCTTGFVGEAIGVCVSLRNPLNIQITLQDICLQWTMKPENESSLDSSKSTGAAANSVKEIVLPPDSTKYVMLKIIPNCIGELQITGLSYYLCDSVSGIKVSGHQSLLLSNKLDRRLHITVAHEVPHLDISFSGLKKELVSCEIIPLKVFLKNTGSTSVSKILLACSENFLIASEDEKKTSSIFNIRLDKPLDLNEYTERTFYVQPAFKGMTNNLELLFYYECGVENMKPRYRLSRHSWPTHVYNSLRSETRLSRSQSSFSENDQGMNISVRVSTNVLDSAVISNMQLETINIISSLWKLVPQVLPANVSIKRGECLYMLVKAVKDRNKDKTGPVSTFKFSENVMPSWCEYFIPAPPEPSGCTNLDMLCALTWSADIMSGEGEEEPTRKAYGLHQVILAKPDQPPPSPLPSPPISTSTTDVADPKPTVAPPTETESFEGADKIKDALSVKIQQPQTLKHNFSTEKLCVVPVKFWLENTSSSELSFIVEASPFPPPQISESNVSFHYAWLGKFIHNITLLPDAMMCITLHAGITCNCAFDLSSRLKVEVKTVNNLVVVIPKPEAVLMVC